MSSGSADTRGLILRARITSAAMSNRRSSTARRTEWYHLCVWIEREWTTDAVRSRGARRFRRPRFHQSRAGRRPDERRDRCYRFCAGHCAEVRPNRGDRYRDGDTDDGTGVRVGQAAPVAVFQPSPSTNPRASAPTNSSTVLAMRTVPLSCGIASVTETNRRMSNATTTTAPTPLNTMSRTVSRRP